MANGFPARRAGSRSNSLISQGSKLDGLTDTGNESTASLAPDLRFLQTRLKEAHFLEAAGPKLIPVLSAGFTFAIHFPILYSRRIIPDGQSHSE
jgi:hypothetical protein